MYDPLIHSGAGIAYGGFGRRVLAYAVDVAVETAIMLPVGAGLGAGLAPAGDNVATVVAVVTGLLFDAIYFSCFESSPLQGTPGKRLLGMAVVDLDGARLTLARASGRYAAKTLSAVILFAGFIQIALQRRKQGLHDVVAGTLVVRRRLRERVAPSAVQAA